MVSEKQPIKTSKLLSSYSPSQDGIDSNLLILLHGLGDNHRNFIQFGQKMRLPQTAILSINGLHPIPFIEDGKSWWDPCFDLISGEVLLPNPSSLASTRNALIQEIKQLIVKTKYNTTQIFLFGFGQGGTVALDLALYSDIQFGGCISVSGFLFDDTPKIVNQNANCLLSFSERNEDVNKSWLFKTKIAGVELEKIQGKVPNTLPQSEDEMRKIMAFLASRLFLRNMGLENHPDIHEVQL